MTEVRSAMKWPSNRNGKSEALADYIRKNFQLLGAKNGMQTFKKHVFYPCRYYFDFHCVDVFASDLIFLITVLVRSYQN